MKYNSYRYLWPPRPETAAPPSLISFYERRGWIPQIKKNGTCTVIFACGDTVIFKNRHNEDHAAWVPQPQHIAFFAGRAGWNVYEAELLHSKGPRIKNHLYLFDILVCDGEELIGETCRSRQDLLRQRFPSPAADIIGSRAGLGARYITDDFSHADPVRAPSKLWPTLSDLDEGFVFKDPNARLLPCITAASNGAWQVKVRRPHMNYSF